MKQIVLDLTDEQAVRICAAAGRVAGLQTAATKDSPTLPRPATLDEVHDRLIAHLDAIVQGQEADMARQAAAASVAPLGVALKVVELAAEPADVQPTPKSV